MNGIYLRPRLFLYFRLLGRAPEIVIRKHTQQRKIQPISQEPNYFLGDLPQFFLAGLIG
jgi:hypothetical protein